MGEHSELLGKEKISKLLMHLSAPAMIGMIVQALYNVVDTIYIGRSVGFLGIAGLTIVFPIHMLILSFSQTVGIGGASIISRSLGSGDKRRADHTFGNVIILLVIISVAIMIPGYIFIVPILKIFGATDTILPYSLDYLTIILFGTFFFVFGVAINNVVRAEGNAKVAMYTMFVSAGMNIVLDPIFIFGFNMGIRGAALATVISQLFMAVYLLYYFLRGNSVLTIKAKYLKINPGILKEILTIGASSFARQSSVSLGTIIVNHVLAVYGGDIGIAAYGVINKLLSFALMPMFGIVQGLQPMVGFNYGACRYDRVKESIQLSILVNVAISTAAFLLFMIFPGIFISLFTKETELIEISSEALRLIMLVFPVVGYQLIGAGIYQALGKAFPALVLSLSRQVLFFIPIILILPHYFNLPGVWLSFPGADLLSFLLTYILVRREMKLLKSDPAMESEKWRLEMELKAEGQDGDVS